MENTAGPTILKTPDISQTAVAISKNPKNWFKKNIFLAVIVLLILALGGFGAYSYFSPQAIKNINILQPKINEITGARLSLMSDKESYKKGDSVSVIVKLYTGGHSADSTDLVVKYDPAFLKPQPQSFVAVGQIYSEYPAAQIDTSKGLIGVSGITIPGSNSFSGVGTFAKLNFTTLKEGQTQVSVDFQPGLTSDSNVVKSGSTTDVLNMVDNASINITATDSVSNTTKPSSCGNFTQYCETDNGAVGTQVCNTGTIVNNSCAYDPNLTVSCEACKI